MSNIVGANAERSRSHNRQVVLGRVRAAGQTGRAEIARGSGLSTQAVSNIIADLLEDGLIAEQGVRAGGRGLPVVQYGLNPSGGYAVGVEIRPDAIFATVLDLCGQALVSERQALGAGDRDQITADVQALTARVTAAAGVPHARVLGVGIVMPGPFGLTGLSGSGSELLVWQDVTPAKWFSDALGLPVIVENDANAAAVAERVSGVAQGLETYAFLYFGSGLGLGIVQNGRLIAGAYGNAGEIGHIPVPSAGGIVPLEAVVSRLSVQEHLRAAGVHVASGADLEAAFAAQLPAMTNWLGAAAEPLSHALTTIENLLDPETIILGGAMPDVILDHLLASVTLAERSVSIRAARTTPRLMRGASGRMTATLGAAALVINQEFTPQIAAAS
ncbi:MAG: ROK family transcriptional regulator [Pseudomonadota bacterium]